MKTYKIFKIITFALMILFICLVVMGKTGYYEYELSKNTKLTNEAIERFEKDVKEGKSIDIDDYYEVKEKNYNNKVSNLGNKLSNKLEELFSKGFSYLFKYISNQTK